MLPSCLVVPEWAADEKKLKKTRDRMSGEICNATDCGYM